ncbi:DgyrCDS13017 [Dimorphilus gyrociliatus]|uniref:DgyrCDS13017 n=1 Tax=Dimorphilus gyrociliatus TaxID=2664684 RepID=A0A7I8W9H1_9ANNE|nr:DgyrCDS13017 [Dimorphilus gyrociliatus]
MNGSVSTTRVEPLSQTSAPLTTNNLKNNMIREVWQDEKEKKPTFLWSYRLGNFMQELQERIRYFLKFDTTTRTRLIYKERIRFPTITICNENRVVLSKAKVMDPYTVEMIKLIWSPDPLESKTIEITDDNRDLANNSLMNWENAYITLSHTQKEVISSCVFKGELCKDSYLIDVSTTMGRCFQFNPRGQNHYATAAGSADPLILILDTKQHEYLAANSPSAGFRILLHEKDTVPEIYQRGIKLAPGMETVVSATLKESKYLPKPYGNCNNDATYRQATCFHNCSSNYVAKHCGCIDIDMTPKDKVPICAPLNFPCTRKKLIDYFKNQEFRKCDCPSQCDIITYQSSISGSPISDYYLQVINKDQPSLTAAEVDKNIVIVSIYFSSMISEEVTESAAYSWLALMSDVGGAFGLILGATFLTLVELIDFLVVSTFEYCTVKAHEKQARSA